MADILKAKRIAWIGTEIFTTEPYRKEIELEYPTISIDIYCSASEGLVGVTSQRYDLAVLEALLSPGKIDHFLNDTNQDYNTVSLDLVEKIKREKPELPIVVYSMIYSSLVRDSRACFNEKGAEYVPLLNSLPTDFYQNHLKKHLI